MKRPGLQAPLAHAIALLVLCLVVGSRLSSLVLDTQAQASAGNAVASSLSLAGPGAAGALVRLLPCNDSIRAGATVAGCQRPPPLRRRQPASRQW